MRRILIIGAGGHGQVVADLLRVCCKREVTILGFIDDDRELGGRSIMQWQVLGGMDRLAEYPEAEVALGLGDNRLRRQVGRLLVGEGRSLPPLVHPAATVAEDAHLGPGAVIAAGVVVCTGAEIGAGAILNTGCTVDHHNRIGSWSHIAPGAHLGGTVTVGDGALVGIGASVVPNTAIGDWAVVGAGSVVHRAVPAGVTVVGVPARVHGAAAPEASDE